MLDFNSGAGGRRRVLKAAVAGFAGGLIPGAAFGQDGDPSTRLLRSPKRALVVGNSAYRIAPALRNPANDAKAMAAALRDAGFDVQMLLDTDRASLERAIQAHAKELASRKAVGLFYFAGHGMQLDWRNYLLPVEADIAGPDDVARHCVDVATLIEGIAAASNPMNIVVLDACRENPFGDRVRAQKGLSQMDAPVATLLAYATAPGNVASDGEGENGLYTENLLREMKAREAGIEDVFKRVRLGVRRKSNGRQIPWESTSLEDDFYFYPPAKLVKASRAEAERLFRQQLTEWESVRDSRSVARVEDYLRRYPSGNFSELAQAKLDQLLALQGEQKVKVVTSASNPFTKGAATSDTNYRVGDSYTYRETDLFTRIEKTVVDEVTEITADTVVFSSGLVTDLLGNMVRARDGRRFTPRQLYPAEYTIGKRWVSRFIVENAFGPFNTEMNIRVEARESVRVPAGQFDAFRVEARGVSIAPGIPPIISEYRYWIAPDRARQPVIVEDIARRGASIVRSSRYEMVSFRQA